MKNDKQCCVYGVTYNTEERQITISTKEKNYCGIECLVKPETIKSSSSRINSTPKKTLKHNKQISK